MQPPENLNEEPIEVQADQEIFRLGILTGPVRKIGDFLRRLDEEYLAFYRDVPEGREVITYRQFLGLSVGMWNPKEVRGKIIPHSEKNNLTLLN